MGITAVIGAVGIGMSAVGTYTSITAASRQADAQKQMIADQQRAEAVRQQAMQLDAQRKQMQLVREAQKARALALSTATNQGAQFGSALPGSYGQISGQYNTNALGINQNLYSGQEMFGINQSISQDKMDMATAGADAAFGSGLSSLGGAMINSAGTIGNIFGGKPGPTGGNSPYSMPTIRTGRELY